MKEFSCQKKDDWLNDQLVGLIRAPKVSKFDSTRCSVDMARKKALINASDDVCSPGLDLERVLDAVVISSRVALARYI